MHSGNYMYAHRACIIERANPIKASSCSTGLQPHLAIVPPCIQVHNSGTSTTILSPTVILCDLAAELQQQAWCSNLVSLQLCLPVPCYTLVLLWHSFTHSSCCQIDDLKFRQNPTFKDCFPGSVKCYSTIEHNGQTMQVPRGLAAFQQSAFLRLSL
eukprot:GHRR01018666.1.p1 GENE.GHRR01018666.1~~GHRR01018666.1.p1  ORF type:complete len:156 (+),score=19.87 GHRR01018666.1:521-988(+)